MSFRLFTGEYLKSPYALHFGLNYCTHGCWYCFANANNPNRRADVNDLAKIIKYYDKGSDIAEFRLLKAGHPMLVSNDSDPCSKSSKETFKILHDLSVKYKFRLVYQTRGGEIDAENIIINGEKTSVYVSLTTDDEALGRQMEPGAPPHSQRMMFIKKLKNAGHNVIVGLNPFVPDWWIDVNKTIKQLADLGVMHIWHQPLHISRFQEATFRRTAKEGFVKWIEYGRLKKEPEDSATAYDKMLDECKKNGINTIRGGVSERLGFWDDYFSLGFPFVPTLDSLAKSAKRIADENKGKYMAFGIDEFNEWADFGVKDGSKCTAYLCGFGRSIRNTGDKGNAATMEEAHRYMWKAEDFPTIFRHSIFSRIDAGDDCVAADENNIPLFAVIHDADYNHSSLVTPDECMFINKIPRC